MKMNIQFFAEKNNIKKLKEQRAEKVQELKDLYETVEAEQRAINEEEEQKVNDIQKEIDDIDKTIKTLEGIKKRLEETGGNNEEGGEGASENDESAEQRAQDEEKMFAEYLRGVANGELRADTNMTLTDNGAVIPETIAQRIIEKVYEISPILERATKYNIKGSLVIPFYPADANDIEMAYADEFEELEASAGKFGSITLSGFLAGALTKVSRSLMNNSQFDIVSFVVNHMAQKVARWIEGELLKGTASKIEGLSTVTQGVTAASQTAITADELIDLQDSVKDAFQQRAIWIMSSKTRTAIRKLKDGNGRYLLQDDINAAFGRVLLGKDVYVSDNMPEMAAGSRAIYYGDMSGLAVKITENFEAQVLREIYATQHAIGVVGWTEIDAKVEDEQKISVLTMASGD
ncbi:phage major capsid protein [Anaerostipes butyraticus]|nr:phage major capsid protein [Anaerostipes butyraticus]